ncbi:Uncharacterised protein [Legionella busanensis]|uniref:Swiss Army Knife 2H phosphoesterase domain-containing protein n=1 Tax=Legionella busanensis TaxID=190655 RepID=A0A378JKS0_9GAMM|nr:hypothetical protein [Legionella busanensis]STX51835.1 Uncharacterised protein [Legionella busanensis]
MKTPIITPLKTPKLMEIAAELPLQGTLAMSTNKLVYLDIDNDYIYRLYPLLDLPLIKKPDYFNSGGIGAHISIIYPEEHESLIINQLGNCYYFTVQNFVSAQFEHKTYYALLVKSFPLLQLRQRYGLPDYLNFKGYKISFHITIAKSVQLNC